MRAFVRDNRGPVILATAGLVIAATLAGTWSTRAGAIAACLSVLAGIVWWFSDSDEFHAASRRGALVMAISVMVGCISLILTIYGLVSGLHSVVSIIPQVVLGLCAVAVVWAVSGRNTRRHPPDHHDQEPGDSAG